MTPMMVVPMLRKIEFCRHMTCVGLLMTQPGPELTLFLSSDTNVPSCEADVALLIFWRVKLVMLCLLLCAMEPLAVSISCLNLPSCCSAVECSPTVEIFVQ